MTTKPDEQRAPAGRSIDPLAPILRRQGVVLLDGGLATELEARGADLAGDLWSAQLVDTAPAQIRAVHEAYLHAGADCLIAATYQATIEGYVRHGVAPRAAEALFMRAVSIACDARDAFWRDRRNRVGRCRPLVAASLGPYGAACADGSEYSGAYDLDRAGLEKFHRRRLTLLAGAGADLLACETIPSADEARALVHIFGDWTTSPVPPAAWLSFSCRDAEHVSDGTPLAAIAAEVAHCPAVVAIGVNCVPPRLVAQAITVLRRATPRAVVVYPNSGEAWDAARRAWRGDADADDFAAAGVRWRDAGAIIIGGCCRTGPEHIRRLRARLLPSGRADGVGPRRRA